MADSTLTAIQSKVRRLTRSPSPAQLPDTLINEYVNTFVLYDFPEHLRLFNLRKQFTFYTNPFQDVYTTGTDLPIINPLYNFKNLYISMSPPVYIAGYNSLFSQSREQFFGIYPMTNSIASIGVAGDGVTTSFTGQINTQGTIVPGNLNQQVCLLQNNVLFSSVDNNFEGLALVDVPVIDAVTGNPTVNGNLYIPGQQPTTPPTVVNPANTVNYFSGAFTITFSSAPQSGQAINSQTVPQVVTLPQALLFYEGQFTVRPVPDQPYRINFEVYARPTELLAANQSPDLQEWWQYIAYGAAKKVFEDRMDMESVQLIMPEYRKQENLVLRRTIVQNTNQRVATIYTEQVGFGGFNNGFGGSGGAF